MSDFNVPVEYKNDQQLFELITKNISSIEFEGLYDLIKYQGFNRGDYLKSALSKLSSSTLIKIAMIGAVRGSNFKKINDLAGLPDDVKKAMNDGIILSTKPKKAGDITITRCTAAIPQWSAYAMLKAGVPGRLSKSRLPGCLQFPAAGSLPMSESVRKEHIKFNSEFSALIGGSFKLSIYRAMYNDLVPVNSIPDEILSILGVNRDSDAIVDIDKMLEDYADEVDEDDVVDTKKRKRTQRRS